MFSVVLDFMNSVLVQDMMAIIKLMTLFIIKLLKHLLTRAGTHYGINFRRLLNAQEIQNH